MMKWLKWFLASALLSTNLLALEIKDLPEKLTLSSALYNHCLELTQSQQLLKLYILSALKNSYKSPKKTLKNAIPKYDQRLEALHAFFDKKFKGEKRGRALQRVLRYGKTPSSQNCLQSQTKRTHNCSKNI